MLFNAIEGRRNLETLKVSWSNKNCAYRDSNSEFHSRVRRFAGLSIPGRDIDFMSCSVFICALRSLYSALNSVLLQHIEQSNLSALMLLLSVTWRRPWFWPDNTLFKKIKSRNLFSLMGFALVGICKRRFSWPNALDPNHAHADWQSTDTDYMYSYIDDSSLILKCAYEIQYIE